MTQKSLYDQIKDKPSKEMLRTYRDYAVVSFLLEQDLTVLMEDYLYYQTCHDDTHCFIITLKDNGKYILVDDYFQKERIGKDLIFQFAEEFGLRLESISHEITETYDDYSKKHYTIETNHHRICYELLKNYDK